MIAALIENGVVANIIVVDSLAEHPGLVEVPDGHYTEIGLPASAAIRPVIQPAQAPAETITPLAFIERFTDAEQLAIVTAAMTVPQVRLWYDKLIASTQVVFSDPRLSAGLDALVAGGLITAQRRAEILPGVH